MLYGNVWNYFKPEMFKEYNCNPKGINTSDCLFRALALFFDKSWDDITKMNEEFYMENGLYLYAMEFSEKGYGTPAIYRFLESMGFHNIIPDYKEAEGDTYLGIVRPPKFMTEHPEVKRGKYLFLSTGHAVTMIDGTVYDTAETGAIREYTHCYKWEQDLIH